ncbi:MULTISPECIES: ribbon-helix-helix domain-containing protein [Cyanophyceae]|nr:CopG family transcriptional regulator [Trichocoleus sp. FACHB-40]
MRRNPNASYVCTYITHEMKKELEEWANEEERSMSWLVAKLIEEALLRRR